MIAWNNVQLLLELKPKKQKNKKKGPKFGPSRPRLGPKLDFCYFFKLCACFPLNSLG